MVAKTPAVIGAVVRTAVLWIVRDSLRVAVPQLVVLGLAAWVCDGSPRAAAWAAAALLVGTAFGVAWSVRGSSDRRRAGLASWVGTGLSLGVLGLARGALDGGLVFGPAPGPIEFQVLGVLWTLCVTCTAPVVLARGRGWAVAACAVGGVGLLGGLYAHMVTSLGGPESIVRAVSELDPDDPSQAWELAAYYAMGGREGLARALVPESGREASGSLGGVSAVSWEEGLASVAQAHSLILVMEAHHVSEHRAWLRRALPVLRAHGFQTYAAEGLWEPGAVLSERGYPVAETGYYVQDPRFANLLRDALALGFELVSYDGGIDMETREAHQAERLAAALAAAPNGKLVVHVGFHHVLKHPVPGPDGAFRWMAARLWEETGVEPFTVYQVSSGVEVDPVDHAALWEALGPADVPRWVQPPPAGLVGDPFEVYPEEVRGRAVDALVLHPPVRTRSPVERPAFLAAPDRRRVVGRLVGGPRPVLVRALDPEHPEALPFDQVLLGAGEDGFAVWVPEVEVVFDVWGGEGAIEAEGVEAEGEVVLWVGR